MAKLETSVKVFAQKVDHLQREQEQAMAKLRREEQEQAAKFAAKVVEIDAFEREFLHSVGSKVGQVLAPVSQAHSDACDLVTLLLVEVCAGNEQLQQFLPQFNQLFQQHAAQVFRPDASQVPEQNSQKQTVKDERCGHSWP